MGHRPAVKGGYFPVPPVDSAQDLRAEMLTMMGEMGVDDREAPPRGGAVSARAGHQVRHAGEDRPTTCRSTSTVVHNVAHSYGKTATFMPKPIYGDNGSGMHCHQSIWKDGKPLFAGIGYADLSEMALYYIGGIIKHAKALNAFTNPPTNSYKRLIPGFEAPVLLAYSARNRSASCRIPYATSPKAKRVEVRFPDPSANPYLAFAAHADGRPGRHPEQDPSGRPDGQEPVRPAAGGADGRPDRVRLAARGARRLEADHEFLAKGDVFAADQIEAYIELKWGESIAFEHTAAPGRVQDVLLGLIRQDFDCSFFGQMRMGWRFFRRPFSFPPLGIPPRKLYLGRKIMQVYACFCRRRDNLAPVPGKCDA